MIRVTNEEAGVESHINPDHIVGYTLSEGTVYVAMSNGDILPVDQTVNELNTAIARSKLGAV